MATKKASSTGRAKRKAVAKKKPPTARGKAKVAPKPLAKTKPPAKTKPVAKTKPRAKAKPVAKAKPRSKPAPTTKAISRAPAGKTRVVAKVSPLKGTSVSDWVKRLPSEQAAIVDTLLTLAASAAPDAKVTIKWAQPVIELDGPVAYIKPAKAHVTFGFWRGTELDDPRGLLAGGDRMKHVRLASLADVDRATLSAWIAEATRLNRVNGDPTRR